MTSTKTKIQCKPCKTFITHKKLSKSFKIIYAHTKDI